MAEAVVLVAAEVSAVAADRAVARKAARRDLQRRWRPSSPNSTALSAGWPRTTSLTPRCTVRLRVRKFWLCEFHPGARLFHRPLPGFAS